jgi:hypothetical protein
VLEREDDLLLARFERLGLLEGFGKGVGHDRQTIYVETTIVKRSIEMAWAPLGEAPDGPTSPCEESGAVPATRLRRLSE